MTKVFNLLVLLYIATLSASCNQRAKISTEILSIEVDSAKSKLLPNRMQFIAPISANYSATIQPRISGFLLSSLFDNGMPVKKGQLIFTLDDAPQRANRLAAEATLSSAKAKAAEAKRNYERAIPLARINAISQTQLDQY